MHRDNLYQNPIDFKELAETCPDLKKYLTKNSTLNFHDPDAVRELTKSLLKRDFKYDVELSADRLCPPVPNRLNYILWLKDLLGQHKDRDIVGLDIGCGASAIYPLLGCASSPKWKFVATDIDEESLRRAKLNVEKNKLSERIDVRKGSGEKLIELGSYDRLDFTMCNPPFYSSEEELLESAKAKALPPSSACTGAPIEMVVEGGEIAVVQRMIRESLQLKERVEWYTTMLGKLSSVITVVESLRKENIGNYVIAEFIQGKGKTKRWAVGWSFGDRRVRDDIGRQPWTPKLSHVLPFPTAYRVPVPADTKEEDIAELINKELSALPLNNWSALSNGKAAHGASNGNVWSRAARRQRQRAESTGEAALAPKGDPFEFEVEYVADSGHSDAAMETHEQEGKEDHMEWDNNEEAQEAKEDAEKVANAQKHVNVVLHWKRGVDQTLWESFCGMLKRKISEKFLMPKEKAK